jgi:hypothetical protein
MWFKPWEQWVRGSALDAAVEATSDGSTFVSASSPPPNSAASPLARSSSYRAPAL